MMETPMIEVKHLKKYFDTPKGLLHAVDDISFKIGKGKTMGVVGESGCGKSTLGRTIIHLLESTDGQIFLNGEDITRVDRKKMHEINEKMQIVFQDPYSSLNPRQTVEEIIKEPLKLSGRYKKRAELDEKTEELMRLVGIDERLRLAYPHELDGGRRQRVGIARALALSPDFIVCDEPVSALDVSVQAQVLNLLMDLLQEMGLTYLFISHDLNVVRCISDRIYIMYLGAVCEYGEAEAIFEHPRHPYTHFLLSAVPVVDPDDRIENKDIIAGEIPSPMNPPSGCKFHTRCPYATDICKTEIPAFQTEEGRCFACHHPL